MLVPLDSKTTMKPWGPCGRSVNTFPSLHIVGMLIFHWQKVSLVWESQRGEQRRENRCHGFQMIGEKLLKMFREGNIITIKPWITKLKCEAKRSLPFWMKSLQSMSFWGKNSTFLAVPSDRRPTLAIALSASANLPCFLGRARRSLGGLMESRLRRRCRGWPPPLGWVQWSGQPYAVTSVLSWRTPHPLAGGHPPAWHDNVMDGWGARSFRWRSVLVIVIAQCSFAFVSPVLCCCDLGKLVRITNHPPERRSAGPTRWKRAQKRNQESQQKSHLRVIQVQIVSIRIGNLVSGIFPSSLVFPSHRWDSCLQGWIQDFGQELLNQCLECAALG